MLSGCGDMCGSDPLVSITSPNGKLRAVSYVYDCGATTGFSTQISVLDKKEPISSSGNILGTDGKISISMVWESDEILTISNITKLKIYKQVRELDGITIKYQ